MQEESGSLKVWGTVKLNRKSLNSKINECWTCKAGLCLSLKRKRTYSIGELYLDKAVKLSVVKLVVVEWMVVKTNGSQVGVLVVQRISEIKQSAISVSQMADGRFGG